MGAPASVEIRAATAGDWQAVCGIHAASVRALGASRYSPEQIDSWSQGPDRERYVASLDDGEVYLVERAGVPCGYGRVVPAVGEIEAVYVHPDHAGTGLGTTILVFLEERARVAGAGRARLRASLNAEGFYARAGWRAIERGTHATRGGVELACVWMEKPLEA